MISKTPPSSAPLPAPDRPRAFTIPEMLAVVAIIAMIICILMPSLHWAKYRARTAICISNKHQIVIAVRSYSTDNVARFPNAQGSGNHYWMQDHPAIVFTAPQKWYGVPLEMWACAASDAPQLPYHWGGYNPAQKWKMMDSAWWVIRGSIGASATVNASRPNLVSDRTYLVSSASVLVSEYIRGNVTPDSGPHSYRGKVLEGAVGRADGSCELILAEKMQIRCPNESWGAWWY